MPRKTKKRDEQLVKLEASLIRLQDEQAKAWLARSPLDDSARQLAADIDSIYTQIRARRKTLRKEGRGDEV